MTKIVEVRISKVRLRRVAIAFFALSVLTILVTPMSASANTVFSPVNFSSQANFTWLAPETDPDGTTATYFPGGPSGSVTLGGIPFKILSNAAGFQAWNGYVASSGRNGTVSITMPVGVYGVTEVYTLINTYWGAPGVSYTAVVFTGSGGATYTENLVGDSDIRNWCCGGTINGTSTINVYSEASSPINGSPGYLDMQHIVLPAAFATQTLVSIQLIDSGATGVQRTILDGLTVVSQASAQIASGTVMVATGNGKVTEFDQNGNMLGQLDTTTRSFEMGSPAFDSAGNILVPDSTANQVTKFDPTGALIGPFGGPYNVFPKSIAFDATGNVYVGQAGGTLLLKFSPSGTLLTTFSPATESVGVPYIVGPISIELASDQCTLFYTTEGVSVERFNVCTNTQLPAFNTAPLPAGFCCGAEDHRLLPLGGMLVADSMGVVRLDASGAQIQTYTLPGTVRVYGLTLDPDGTSFWTSDFYTGEVFKLDIATGSIIKQWSAAGAAKFSLAGGLSVKLTVLTPQQETEVIINSVNTLSSQGVVNGGQANSLLVKLQHAIARLNAGNKAAAIGNLNAFIGEVNDLLASGVLTPSQAASLVSAAQGVVAALS